MSWASSTGRRISRQIIRETGRKYTYRKVQRQAEKRPESVRVETPTGVYWMSPIEHRLYGAMLDEGLSPVPQYPVEGYIVDFAFPEFKLAVEADGVAYHQGANRERDRKRDWILSSRHGWTVKRFWGTTIHSRASNCAYVVKCEVERRSAQTAERERLRKLDQQKRRDAVSAPFRKVASLFRSQSRGRDI